jgi:hypothetical protein
MEHDVMSFIFCQFPFLTPSSTSTWYTAGSNASRDVFKASGDADRTADVCFMEADARTPCAEAPGPKIRHQGTGAIAEDAWESIKLSESAVGAGDDAARGVSVAPGMGGNPADLLLEESNSRSGPTICRRGILRIGAHAQQAWELVTNLQKAEAAGTNVARGVPVTADVAQHLVPGLAEAHLAAAVTWKPQKGKEAQQIQELRRLGAPLHAWLESAFISRCCVSVIVPCNGINLM